MSRVMMMLTEILCTYVRWIVITILSVINTPSQSILGSVWGDLLQVVHGPGVTWVVYAGVLAVLWWKCLPNYRRLCVTWLWTVPDVCGLESSGTSYQRSLCAWVLLYPWRCHEHIYCHIIWLWQAAGILVLSISGEAMLPLVHLKRAQRIQLLLRTQPQRGLLYW